MHSTESFQPLPPDKSTLYELGALRQETQLMGANDSEILEINKIIDRFKEGKCTAQEALGAVIAIKNSKQDYH